MSDWWTKKLSGEKPTPPRPSFTPPVNPVPTHITPQHVTQTQQVQPQQSAESLSDALRMGLTNGGEATRRDTMSCPACGGNYLFSRTTMGGGTTQNGHSPAPRCYTCGWNGRYEQGDQSKWA